LRLPERPVSTPEQNRFSVSHWAAWAPGIETPEQWRAWARAPHLPAGDAAPPVTAMVPMLRRRAGRLGRMALEVLYQSRSTDAPIIYCSRHGELDRAVALLRELQAMGQVSPQEFSVAVHNATAGLYSIATQFHGNIQSLAAGAATPFMGLIEACAMLASGVPSVRLILCDQPVPDPFQPFADSGDCPFAILLELAAAGDFALERLAPAARPARGSLPPALALLHFLLGSDAEAAMAAGPHLWRLSRVAPS
jgi:hypothetical protein